MDWAVVAARSSTASSIDWCLVLPRISMLAALAAACAALATLAFRSYARTL